MQWIVEEVILDPFLVLITILNIDIIMKGMHEATTVCENHEQISINLSTGCGGKT